MAHIIPFKGLRYNLKQFSDIGLVTAPPYDVISPQAQEGFYRAHPYNCIRLILNKILPEDNETNNRYTRAAACFKDWLAQGILIENLQPCFYVYQQEYTGPQGDRVKRKGFIGLIKLEDIGAGKVLPHEKTLSRPKEDRLKLMLATGANLSQVFSLYSDPAGKIDALLAPVLQGKPLFSFTDEEGVFHEFWLAQDPEILRRVTQAMQDKQIFIADGHHRYETALNYRNAMRQKFGPGENKPWDYMMMMLVNMDGQGLSVFPTHRMLKNLPNFDFNQILKGLDRLFSRETHSLGPQDGEGKLKGLLKTMEERGKKAHTLGLWDGKAFHFLTLKNEEVLDKEITPSLPQDYKKLDVTILHFLIIEKVLGIDSQKVAMEEHITYTRSDSQAFKEILEGKYQLSFFLNATKVSEVKNIASMGLTMPQKSTYFYPKIRTGLVMYKIL